MDHLKIDIINGEPGPWLHLFAPFNKECNGRDPVDLLWALGGLPFENPDAEQFVAYSGPLPTSEEYQAEAAKYDGVNADAPTPSPETSHD